MVIETERLILREFTPEDFSALFEILSDPETMQHYPQPFDAERTKGWIKWNLQNYKEFGFGLWAVVLRETGELIGDCGLTLQMIDGDLLPEIGYHIHKKHWRKGFGSEAARAVRDWAFEHTEYDCLYSYMKYTNIGSYSTAIANGMKRIKEYPDEKNRISYAYAITRKEWSELKAANLLLREIERKDYEAVAAIWRDVLGFSSATSENVTRTYEKMKNDSRYRTFVADVGGEVAGFVTAVETLAVDRPTGYIKMNGLAVLPRFQRRGIGKMLMERVEQLAAQRGASAIGLASGFQRTDAHAFYERLGYQKTSFWFRKDVAHG